MGIVWFKKDNVNLFASLNANCIILNKHCSTIFTDYDYCALGFESKEKFVIVKPIKSGDAKELPLEAKLYRLNFNDSYLRISCTDFIHSLVNNYSLDITSKKKVEANWNKEEEMLTVSLA